MKLSIIIPCYNHGQFIQETLDSIAFDNRFEYEVIIVNDGSTDEFTVQKLDELKAQNFNVISHTNHGLAYTRNVGIAVAKGEYILPLDADNKIIPEYVYEAIAILDKQPYDIVYGKPLFFGADIPNRRFLTHPFSGDDLLMGNYIDACAIFRNQVWTDLGGYDGNMPYQGNEDWEFWIRAYLKKFRYYYYDDYAYHYRILPESMAGINNRGPDDDDPNFQYIIAKHYKKYLSVIQEQRCIVNRYKKDMRRPLRSAGKHLYRFITFKRKY